MSGSGIDKAPKLFIYVAWGLDLRALKTLALSSILRSSLPADRREKQLELLRTRWQHFIAEVIEKHSATAVERAASQPVPRAA